jgi:tRNA A-37 threonylcarbamoyl transferase component Bud32
MSTTHRLAESELVELEPASKSHPAREWLGGLSEPASPIAPVAFTQESAASRSGEADALRRRRLVAAAACLAMTFGLLLIWVFASDNPGTLTAGGSRYSLRVGLIALRFLLAAGVAGLLLSELKLSQTQLRVIEYVLFLGLTVILIVSQYFVGLDLMRRGPEYATIVVAFIKDGVIQMLALMMIYGTLIPNPPPVAARALAAMFGGPVGTMLLLKLHPAAGPIIAQLSAAEEAGSNILFLAVGAGLAIYGSLCLNGLRAQLQAARRFGQYKLIRKLGVGGMGEVYLAEHALLKRPCALKLIKPEASGDPLTIARFEREVQASARLAHYNTIEIFDYGHADDGTFYYVMEYLEGMSLADLVKTYGPLPAGRMIYILRQVCAGLAEAHALGFIHRDLKPANVFVAVLGGETDVAKVLDFGLVKPTKGPDAIALSADMTVSGTALYMAPEQAMADRSLDARADIYALGAMMYFALTGQPPFRGASPFAVMTAHARDPVVPPSQLRPGLPGDLEEVVIRCLAKKPGERFPNVKALSEALSACAAAHEWGPNRADAWWTTIGMTLIDTAQIPQG